MPRTSLSAIAAKTPTSRVKPKESCSASAVARAPAGLWAASSSTVGELPDDLEPPGRGHLGEAGADEVDVERAALGVRRRRGTPRPRRARQAALCAWWAPMQRQEHVVVLARPRPRSRRAAGRRRRGCATGRRTPGPRGRRCAPTSTERRSSTSAASTGCWASTPYEPGLRIPAFSAAICSTVEPRKRTWSIAIGVTTATCGVGDVGGVPGAAHADLDDRDVDRRVGEGGVGHRGEHLEERQPDVVPGVDQVEVGRHVVVRRDEPLRRRSAAPSKAIRSRIECRCGLVNRPVRRPNSRSSASIIRVVDVLPLVPATWTTGPAAAGAEQVEQLADPVQRRGRCRARARGARIARSTSRPAGSPASVVGGV